MSLPFSIEVTTLTCNSAWRRGEQQNETKGGGFGGERALDGASHLPRAATGFTIRTVTPDLRSGP